MKGKQFSLLNGSETIDGFIDILQNAFIISRKGVEINIRQKSRRSVKFICLSSSKVLKKV